MDREQTPGQHWDGEEMTRDTAGVTEDKPQGEVWNRHQMETDDTEGDSKTETVPATTLDEATDAGGLSGHGQPSGESHWERVEHEDDPTR